MPRTPIPNLHLSLRLWKPLKCHARCFIASGNLFSGLFKNQQKLSLAYGGAQCHGPPSDPKNKKMYKQYSAVAQLREGQGPQFKINWLCFLVIDIRTTQFFLWLLYVSSAWYSFYDFILSLTKLLYTWLLSNLTQVTMNIRKKLRLAWDFSPQASISVFDKRHMSVSPANKSRKSMILKLASKMHKNAYF